MPSLSSGINIQYPISQLILSGEKTIETRTYPVPPKYLGKSIFIIETPGKAGKFKARVAGRITFSSCFKYEDEKSFYKDHKRHLVSKSSQWAWNKEKGKWAWIITKVEAFQNPVTLKQRIGIKFTNNIKY